jgi:predicted nucleic acid-binding protein
LRNDAELALHTVTMAEIAFGSGKIRLNQRCPPGARLGVVALPLGSSTSRKQPRSRCVPTAVGSAADGMIAAVVRISGRRLPTENPADFATTGS